MIRTIEEVEQLVDDTVAIPPMPQVLAEVDALLDAPDTTPADAAAVLGADPDLAAAALRLLRGPVHQTQHAPKSLEAACAMLTPRALRNLVVQAEVLASFPPEPRRSAFDTAWLWDHAVKTAVACSLLASYSQVADGLAREDAATCGLIHDVGKLVLIDSQPDLFREALKRSEAEKVPIARGEADVFGFHHAHVGGLLARRWNLPLAVQAAVLHHHCPPQDREGFARGLLVRAANTYAHLAAGQKGGGYRGDPLPENEFETLGLRPEEHTQIVLTTAGAALV